MKFKNQSNALALLLLFFTFGGYYPFETNAALLGEFGYILARLLCLLLLCWALIYKKGVLCLPNQAFNIIIGVQVLYFAVWGYYLNSIVIMANSYVLVISYLLIVSIMNLISFKKVICFFEYFTIFSGIMTFIGVILFSIGMLNVVSVFDKGEILIQNYGFFFVKVFLEDVDIIQNIRPSGYFDEPGSFAYMAMLLLLLNRVYIHNRCFELCLLILPIVTTSIAHVITATTYVIIFYGNVRNGMKIIGTILFIACLYFTLNYFSHQNSAVDFFNQRIFGRVEKLTSGEGGNSRQSGFDMGQMLVIQYPFGSQPEYINKRYPDFSFETFYSIPLFYGFQGILFYLLPFAYLLYRIVNSRGNTRKILIQILILWGVNLVQRPFYIQPFYIFALYYLFFYKFEIYTNSKWIE